MKTELDVLRDVSQRLESAGVAFMLTGSMAMNFYAQPRMTRDIDLVVKLTADQTDLLISLFEAEYYVDRLAIARAIAQRSVFNLIHNETIIKFDCIVLKDHQYRQEEFARRQRITISDFQAWIVTREDLILSKLYWARDSKSELQQALMNDTDPKIAELVRQRLLERSGTERVIMASGMFETAKAMVLASLPTGLSEIENQGSPR